VKPRVVIVRTVPQTGTQRRPVYVLLLPPRLHGFMPRRSDFTRAEALAGASRRSQQQSARATASPALPALPRCSNTASTAPYPLVIVRRRIYMYSVARRVMRNWHSLGLRTRAWRSRPSRPRGRQRATPRQDNGDPTIRRRHYARSHAGPVGAWRAWQRRHLELSAAGSGSASHAANNFAGNDSGGRPWCFIARRFLNKPRQC